MAESGIYVYVSQDRSRQISVLSMAPATGELTRVQDVSVTGKVEPMAVSPDRRFLYAALRNKPYSIANFAIDAQTGMLILLGYTPAADSAVNISTDRTGRFLLSATNPPEEGGDNADRYSARRTGLVSISAIGDRGCVQGPYELFRTPPKLHSVLPDPSNRFVFGTSCDGDVIVRYAFDAATGLLNPDPLPPVMVTRKSGPRHFKFHPNNRFMYLVNEYDGSLYTFRYDVRNGSLSEIQISSSVPPDFDTKKHARTSDVHFTPDGRWLYVSVRNSATLAAFSVDPATGLLTPAGHFPTTTGPRSFCIDPLGRYLFAVGQLTKNLASYRIDPQTGALTRLADYPMGEGPNWVECVRLP